MSTYQIKLYTKEECTAIGGSWYENGECLKKEGGSYSWDNRILKPKVDVSIKLGECVVEYKNVEQVIIKDISGNQIFSTVK
jgi:hypothetical protein